MGQLQSAIDQLAVEDIEAFTDPELSDSLVELEAGISRLEAERSRRLSLFSLRRTHLEFEYSSPSAFLIDRCQIAPSRATKLVASAHALAQMPVTSARWREGMMASDQVRHLLACQQADPDSFSEHEQMLCDTVAELGIVDTGRALAYWRVLVGEHKPDIEAEKLYARRRVHLSQTFEGMFRLDGYLDPVSGEIVREALEALTPPPAEGDNRIPTQRRADALTDMARQVLDSAQLPEQGGE